MPYYGREAFDPGLILAQIVILQTTFYLSFTILLVIFDRVLGVNTLVSAQIFDYRALTLREFGGWVTGSALIIANLPTALTYVLIVGRAKRCLDFAFTLFIAHLFATIFHSGFPNSFTWWCINTVSAAVLAIACEFMCMRIEMQDIPVDRLPEATEGDKEIERGLEEEKLLDPDDGSNVIAQVQLLETVSSR